MYIRLGLGIYSIHIFTYNNLKACTQRTANKYIYIYIYIYKYMHIGLNLGAQG